MVGKEDLRARGEVAAIPRGEVVGHHGGPRDRARRTREVDREVRETRGCRHLKKGGWRGSRRGRR